MGLNELFSRPDHGAEESGARKAASLSGNKAKGAHGCSVHLQVAT